MATVTMHYKAKNDINGNPRRCYVVYDATSETHSYLPETMKRVTDDGICRVISINMYQQISKRIVAVYDEGHTDYIPVEKHRNVVDVIDVPVRVYNGFIKLGKELGEGKK